MLLNSTLIAGAKTIGSNENALEPDGLVCYKTVKKCTKKSIKMVMNLGTPLHHLHQKHSSSCV